jgi:chemotaxis protein MotB
MRRRKHGGHANHERWLVSYADFITLLFAFFVMMYANSNTDQARAQAIADAFKEAVNSDRLAQALAKMMGSTPKPGKPLPVVLKASEPAKPAADAVQLLPSLKQLNESLRKEIDSGLLEVRMERRGLVISLREASFFPPGDDTVQIRTLPTLQIIAHEIRKHSNPLRLEGHTDAVPIQTARFRSNWELSAARGISMLELFATRFQIDRGRMAIAGFADTAPIAPNDTADGRSRNRRVDIVILNEEAQSREPRQVPAQSPQAQSPQTQPSPARH